MKFKHFLCIILSLSILNGCSNHDELEKGRGTFTEGTVTLFAEFENLTKESQKALLDKLDENNIDYVVDNQGSVFVRERDIDKANSCCKQ